MFLDHPEYFWITNGYSIQTRTLGSKSEVTLIPKVRENNPYSIKDKSSKLYSSANAIVRQANKFKSKYEQILFIHDYIVDLCEYVSTTINSYDAYGCLINKKAVCAGYSAAFQFLLHQIGVPCGRISGSSRTQSIRQVNHEWNYVLLNNDFFYIDVTWDDPLIISNMSNGGISHDYFGITDSELSMTHAIFRSEKQFVPKCCNTDFDYYRVYGFYQNKYVFADVKRCAENQLRSKTQFSIKFGNSFEANIAVRDLIDNQKVFMINGISKRVRYSISQTGLVLTVFA